MRDVDGPRDRVGGESRADARSLPLVLLALAVVFFVLATVAMCAGRYAVSPAEVARVLAAQVLPIDVSDVSESTCNVVLRLRLPRVLAALLVGAALALAGAVYQGIFRNPLVSPDLLGVSNGACVGAAVSILLGLAMGFTQLFAFLGGVLAVALTRLSGGERQLVNVCRALAQQPRAILFDEPTSALDYGNQLRVLRVVRELGADGYAVVIVGNNTRAAAYQALMEDGSLATLSAVQSGEADRLGLTEDDVTTMVTAVRRTRA